VRILRVALTVDVRDRVLIIAGQSFIAVVPLLIIVATLLSPVDGVLVADQMAERLDLDDPTAAAIRGVFEKPPDASGGLGIASWILVLVSVGSLARSIRRTFDRAWGLPITHGARHSVDGLLGVLLLVAGGLVVGWLREEAPPLVFVAAGVLVSALIWMVTCHLFLGRRVPMRDLVVAAVYAAGAQLVVSWWIGVYLPVVVGRYLTRYGLIGVSFAIVTWLIVIAALLVSVAVVSAEVAPAPARRRRASTPNP
jgi:uncharacterized BrkB/YihY/UPF0761 family membrane protein